MSNSPTVQLSNYPTIQRSVADARLGRHADRPPPRPHSLARSLGRSVARSLGLGRSKVAAAANAANDALWSFVVLVSPCGSQADLVFESISVSRHLVISVSLGLCRVTRWRVRRERERERGGWMVCAGSRKKEAEGADDESTRGECWLCDRWAKGKEGRAEECISSISLCLCLCMYCCFRSAAKSMLQQ